LVEKGKKKKKKLLSHSLFQRQARSCTTNDPLGFLPESDQNVTFCVVPFGCDCSAPNGLKCTQFDCTPCDFSKINPPASPWIACCQNDCPGACGPAGAITGCRDRCLESVIGPCGVTGRPGGLCNNVNCGAATAPCADFVAARANVTTLPTPPAATTPTPPTPTPTTRITTTTAAPTTTTAAAPTAPFSCAANCTGDFGGVGQERWCRCCKLDCGASLSNCRANSGYCSTRCLDVPGICPPQAPTPKPTPAPTPVPTPPPTPIPNTPRPPELFPNCIEPVPKLRILWRVDGTSDGSNVRFQLEGPTSGWVGVGVLGGANNCTLGTMSQCMRDANIVVAQRKPDGWAAGFFVGLASGNGAPAEAQHGVVTGLAGMIDVRGPPQQPTPLLSFARKVRAAANFVGLRVAGANTQQQLIYAYGADGDDLMTFHAGRRGIVTVDWSKPTEQCGRAPVTLLPTAPPTAAPAFDCARWCQVSNPVDSDRWCECCQNDCFGFKADCVSQNEFCVPMGKCVRGNYCQVATTTAAAPPTTASASGNPIVSEPGAGADGQTIGIAIGASVGAVCLIALGVGVACVIRRRSRDEEPASRRPELSDMRPVTTLPSRVDDASLPPEVQEFFQPVIASPRKRKSMHQHNPHNPHHAGGVHGGDHGAHGHYGVAPDLGTFQTAEFSGFAPPPPSLANRGRVDTLASLPPVVSSLMPPPPSLMPPPAAVPPPAVGAEPHSLRQLPPSVAPTSRMRTDTLSGLPPPPMSAARAAALALAADEPDELAAMPTFNPVRLPPPQHSSNYGPPPPEIGTLSRTSAVMPPPPGLMAAFPPAVAGGTVRARPPPPPGAGVGPAPGTLKRVKPPPPGGDGLPGITPLSDTVSPRSVSPRPLSPGAGARPGGFRPPPPPDSNALTLPRNVNMSSGLMAMPTGAMQSVNSLPPPPAFATLTRAGSRSLGQARPPPPPM
jgi:hypothetical protein